MTIVVEGKEELEFLMNKGKEFGLPITNSKEIGMLIKQLRTSLSFL